MNDNQYLAIVICAVVLASMLTFTIYIIKKPTEFNSESDCEIKCEAQHLEFTRYEQNISECYCLDTEKQEAILFTDSNE